MSDLLNQLKKLKASGSSIRADDLRSLSPTERAKRIYQRKLQKDEQYRVSILRSVAAFGQMENTKLHEAAKSMDEVSFQRDDVIIRQGDVGDTFYVLLSGECSVTRKQDPTDQIEVPKELSRLSPGSHFGEIALLTNEPRSATVTVVSDTAKLLVMTRAKFELLLTSCGSLVAETRTKIGKDIVERVPLFRSLTAANKQRLLETMKAAHFRAGVYICRQGEPGHTFYIITEGVCSVTVGSGNEPEKEVSRLFPGDFFGEVALIDASSRRTANVVAISDATCMTLSRGDFNRLLRAVKGVLMEQSAMRSLMLRKLKREKRSNTKRRVTAGLEEGGQHSKNVLVRLAQFIMDSCRASLYTSLYRSVLSAPSRMEDFGSLVSAIVMTGSGFSGIVQGIRDLTQRILTKPPLQRKGIEISFIRGLLRQKNALTERICKDWPQFQMMELCQKVGFRRVVGLDRIIEYDTFGTCAYLILRGCARVFAMQTDERTGKKQFRYEEDLMSGDIISPETLEGIHTNLHTVMAISACDLMVIEEDVFNSVQAKGVTKMSVEQKFRILSEVPVFRAWEPYKLYRIAYNLEHAEIPKETVIFRRGETTDRLYILIHGQVDLVHDVRRRDQILTTVQPGNYFGESSVCTFHTNGKVKVEEDATAIASSHVEVLVYGEAHFQMLDSQSLTSFTRAFESKRKWRARRTRTLKHEHRALREAQQKMRDDVHGDAPLRASLRDTSGTATSSASTLSELEATTAASNEATRPREAFELDDLPQEIMRGYDPLFVLSTCKNPRKRQQVLNALKRAQPEASLPLDDQAMPSSSRLGSPPRTSPHPASPEAGNDHGQMSPLRPMAALLSPKIQPITSDEFPQLTLKSLPQRIRSVTYMTPALHALQHRIKLAENSTA